MRTAKGSEEVARFRHQAFDGPSDGNGTETKSQSAVELLHLCYTALRRPT